MHPSNYQLFQGTDYFHHPRKILCGSSQAVPKPSGHAYDFNHHELVLHVLNMYIDVAKEIGDANFLKGVQVDGTDLVISQRKVQLSTFNKDSTVSGLVPVAAIKLGENEKKSDYFLNAEGNWAIPLDSRIGTLTYNNVAYNDVTSYVDARV